MSNLSRLRISRAVFDAADRISSSITAACVIAVLLGPALDAHAMVNAFAWGALFLALTLTAGIVKSMLDSGIKMSETDGGDD